MPKRLKDIVPPVVRAKIGSESSVCPVSGRDVFYGLQDERTIVLGCNPRIPHVIPGIMRAAEELDAVVAFELTRTEGGIDGGYTGQTPEMFSATLLAHAEQSRFTKPFLIHADHVTILNTSEEELEQARNLVSAQIAAGFTSFALDASFNPLSDNINILEQLASPIQDQGYGLEVELGEVKSVGSESSLTEVAESRLFLESLASRGVHPQLLAIDNGSKSGNYLDGQAVSIDLERTGEIFKVAREFGLAGLVQHGITGTPLRIVGRLADFGIRKGNIGTLWQNVAHAGLPLDLMDAMRQWARDNKRDIKYATGAFKADIDTIPEENIRQIAEMAYREAREFLKAFHAEGSATRLANNLMNT
jgi:fructose-bisphosphate aldolase class II